MVMSVAPTVAELPLQDIRFLFGTIPQIRMLPDKLQQTGKAGIGEFKLVAHFPASSGATEADKKAYLNRHAGFQGGDYGIYYDGTYSLDEINWDATNRAGVHLVTQDKYGNTVQFPVVPSKSVPGDLKLLVSEYVESILNPPLMVRCSAIGGRLTPDPNAANTFDLSVNPQQPKCPIKARPHVPQQYHAEEMTMDHGRYVVDASALTDAEIEYLDFYLYGAEEGNTPVMDPMKFGEMVNWRPLDGSEGLKRKRAEEIKMEPCESCQELTDVEELYTYADDMIICSVCYSIDMSERDLSEVGVEYDAEYLRDTGSRQAYATVNFEWTCEGLPEGFDDYSEIEQQVVNQIGYVTDNSNMDFNRHYDTMEVEIDGVFYPCEFEYQLEFNEINYHGAETFAAPNKKCQRRKNIEITMSVVGYGDTDQEAIEEWQDHGIPDDHWEMIRMIKNANYKVTGYDENGCYEDDCPICNA